MDSISTFDKVPWSPGALQVLCHLGACSAQNRWQRTVKMIEFQPHWEVEEVAAGEEVGDSAVHDDEAKGKLKGIKIFIYKCLLK